MTKRVSPQTLAHSMLRPASALNMGSEVALARELRSPGTCRSRGVEDHTRPGRITLGKRSATEAEIKQEEERASQLRGTGGGEE